MQSKILLSLMLALVAPMICGAPHVAFGETNNTVEKGAFGLGLALGEPTGVAAKLYLADDVAVSSIVGGAFGSRGFHAHLDFLWHPVVFQVREHFVLPGYVGIGGRLLSKDVRASDDRTTYLGVRVVGGIVFDFSQIPIDAFGEVAVVPELRIFGPGSQSRLDVNASVGVRYYF